VCHRRVPCRDQLRGRDTRGPLDRRARRVRAHTLGSYVLLEAAREVGLRFVQVSTDEAYGPIEEETFTEESPLRPSSLYSATKAGADLLVASYHHTFGADTLICRGSNNYRPYQYPEELIPLMVLNALNRDSLPVHGDGMQVRNWIFVEGLARGIGFVLDHGVPGEIYNVGGPDECRNIDVVHRILELTGAGEELIDHVSAIGRATTGVTLSRRTRSGHSGGRRPCASTRSSNARSRGIRRTAGGGSQSAPATTASTTNASTGALG
jgi:dTDP-glucose 4,6-dehydratase